MEECKTIINQALREDRAHNDVTSRSVIPAGAHITARLIAKEPGIICGIGIIRKVFKALDKRCSLKTALRDGDRVKKGQVFAVIEGPALAILGGERTALNFIQHLSGVSTLTGRFVLETKGTSAKIYDTRKTLPGLRRLEKYAVRCGGGCNHRMDLKEMALIKDNHLQAIKNLPFVVRKLRKSTPGLKVEIECENLGQVDAALEAGADIIMLDNMTVATLRRAITRIKSGFPPGRRPAIEISGGVNLKTVRKFALLGVDRISVGAITHSVSALDISLEMLPLH